MIHQFEQREWEKMLLPAIRFKFNYWLLKNIGLIMFGAFYFLLGVLVFRRKRGLLGLLAFPLRLVEQFVLIVKIMQTLF